VLPTRIARHGSVLTGTGRLQIRNAVHARDDGPLDPACPCAVCRRWSRAYLRHLLQTGEPTALRLLTWHNLAWTLALIHRTRAAIADGTLASVRGEVAEAYE
jgi:queuine tRNA-ribosyltransferase